LLAAKEDVAPLARGEPLRVFSNLGVDDNEAAGDAFDPKKDSFIAFGCSKSKVEPDVGNNLGSCLPQSSTKRFRSDWLNRNCR
jgi:hypothetical protein